MKGPNKYPLFFRCIWGWLWRVPSQGYHHFPYDSSQKYIQIPSVLLIVTLRSTPASEQSLFRHFFFKNQSWISAEIHSQQYPQLHLFSQFKNPQLVKCQEISISTEQENIHTYTASGCLVVVSPRQVKARFNQMRGWQTMAKLRRDLS